MNERVVFRTAACSDYERLLEECQIALVAWKARREQIATFGPQGKSAGDALQRLQAEYARAYNRLASRGCSDGGLTRRECKNLSMESWRSSNCSIYARFIVIR